MPRLSFSDLYKSPKSPLHKFRFGLQQQQHQQNLQQSQQQIDAALAPGLEYYGDPDLVSRDKLKQKEAVRRYLSSKVRSDWDFLWPPPYEPEEVRAAALARAAAIRASLVRKEQAGLLDPFETFASPLKAKSATTARDGGEDDDLLSDAGSGMEEFESDSDSDFSVVSEDPARFTTRADWTSDVSDDENMNGMYYQSMPAYVHQPCRYETPESVGADARLSPEERHAKAEREIKAEMQWNPGLACFLARRDAWTCARTVRVKPAEVCMSPASASSSSALAWPHRGRFRFHSRSKSEPRAERPTLHRSGPSAPEMARAASSTTKLQPPGGTSAPLSPVVSNSQHSQQSRLSQQSELTGIDTVATTPFASDAGADGGLLRKSLSRWSRVSSPAPARSSSESSPAVESVEYPIKKVIPIPPPLLPAANPMRASIVPSLYLSLYDKVVLNSLQPSCPINLKDMTRACVAGWKRDGEWPPREPTYLPSTGPSGAAAALRKKRRDERQRRESQKKDRLPSPGFSRRMNVFLGRPLTVATPSASVVSPTTVSATGTGARLSRTTTAPAEAASPRSDDGVDNSRGIRRSLQRVLSLGNGPTSPGEAQA